MKNEEQEIFDFFTDNLAKAKQEFQNRVLESKFYKSIQDELQKYTRIKVAVFPDLDWFFNNNWKKLPNNTYIKDGLLLLTINDLYIILIENTFDILFKGNIQTEEEFLMIEKILLR